MNTDPQVGYVVETDGIAQRHAWGPWQAWMTGIGAGLLFAIFPPMLLVAGLATAGGGSLHLPGALFAAYVLTLVVGEVVQHRARRRCLIPSLRKPGRIELSEDFLRARVGRRLCVVPRRDVRAGWIDEGAPVVVLWTRWRTLYVKLPNEDAARRLLIAAGVAPDQRAHRVRLVRASPKRRWEAWGSRFLGPNHELLLMGAAAGIVASVLLKLDWGAWCPAFMAGAFWGDAVRGLLNLALGPEVIVGTDGLAIRRPWRTEFVAFSRVKMLSLLDKEILVELRDESTLVLGAATNVEARRLFARLQDAVKDAEHRAPTRGEVDVLDRKGRTIREWLDAIRRAARATGSYRDGWLGDCDLVDVIGDGRMRAEHRIAAAAALSAREDAAACRRVRIALDASADEAMGAAIEKAIAGELEAADIERVMRDERRAR
jgi:hypothetical protein